MRCQACNRALTDFESTRKSATSGEYLDLCNQCFAEISSEVDALEREDLRDQDTIDDEYDTDDDWNEDRVDTIGQNGNTGEHY